MRLINKKKVEQLERIESKIKPKVLALRYVNDGIIQYLGKKYTEEEFKIINKKNNIDFLNIEFL